MMEKLTNTNMINEEVQLGHHQKLFFQHILSIEMSEFSLLAKFRVWSRMSGIKETKTELYSAGLGLIQWLTTGVLDRWRMEVR